MRRSLLPLLVLAAACTAPTDEARPGAASPGGPEPLLPTLTASPTIGAVATVDVSTPDAANAWIEVSEAGGPTRRFPATADEDGTAHTATLVGLAAATDYTWRVVAELEDGTEAASEPAVFTTEPPPLWLPTLTTVVPEEDPFAPGYVLTTIIGELPAAAIIDRNGRYVWWWQAQEGAMPCQARMARDGKSVLLMVVDREMTDDISALLRVGLDGTTLWERHVSMGHHDFAERADGTIGYLAFDIRPFEGRMTVGDGLVLVDPATDTDMKVWSSWDSFLPNPEETEAFYPFGDDWTHGNGLAEDPATGEWLVSLHNLDTIVRVTPAGEVAWQLGGADSDFTLTGGSAFARQHSPVLTDDGILLFDNTSPDPDALYSRAVAYRVDEATMTYEETWSHDGGKGLYTAYMGTAEREADGSTIVGWGSGGRITRVGPDGELAWQIESAIGSPFGFTHPVATLGEVVE